MGIDLLREGDVFVLRWDGDQNRLNDESVSAWNAALDEVEAADGPAALVTTGAGKFYCNGLDLDQLGLSSEAKAGEEGFRELVPAVLRLMGRLLVFPRPTVAALNGHAFAAGGMLALAQDFRVMRRDRGWFCIPEIDLNMWLAPGMVALLKARLPTLTFHESIVTGRRYTGPESVEHGIVQQVVADDDVVPTAVDIAGLLTDKDPTTLQALKRGMYGDVVDLLESGRLT